MMKKILRKLKRELFHNPISNAYWEEMRIQEKSSPQIKICQVQLLNQYRSLLERGEKLPSIFDTGFRIYSQFEEDGMILFLLAILGMKKKLFVDIGAGNGIKSNCANLAVNLGWYGLFIDGSERNKKTGTEFYSLHPDTSLCPPKFICSMVKQENINQIIQEAGFSGQVDFLSIDIDGNDYWIWDALEVIQPRIVMIETHVEFGFKNIVVPYDPNYVYPGRHPMYHGASPAAMVNLADRKGYRLVGANRYGFNTIYIKKEEGKENIIPTLSVETILNHPRNNERFELFEPIQNWEYISG